MLVLGIVVVPFIAHDLKQDCFLYSEFCQFGGKVFFCPETDLCFCLVFFKAKCDVSLHSSDGLNIPISYSG